MSEEAILEEVTDAPEPIETTEADANVEVEDEQKAEQASESSTDTTEDAQKKDDEQRKFDKLTKKRRAAERDRDYWREQALKSQYLKQVENVEPEPVKTLEDFGYDETKYQQHLFDQARKGAIEEAKRVLKEEMKQESVSKRMSEFNKRMEKYSETVDDFDDVVRNESLSISQTMADVASGMENGPEVLYYLGNNPDLAYEISQLPPSMTGREMGRIEATLAAKAKSGEKVSKAPTPPPKIAGADGKVNINPSTVDSDKMSTDEWMKRRNKQVMRK